MTSPEHKPKKCRGCGEKFTPARTTQVACSLECAVLVSIAKHDKAKRKAYREEKERIKSRQEWLKEAQTAVNRYVRARDEGRPCISCGRHHKGQYHSGHFRSVGANPELRFELLNIHKQCAPCNNNLSGNILNYRLGLIEKIGIEAVAWLEGKHEPKHYTIDDIKEIKARYTRLTRELINKRGD